MTTVTRRRAVCCSTSGCISECGLSADIDKDTWLAGLVCPPYVFSHSSSNVKGTTPKTAASQESSTADQGAL